jgi:hypothetical protein
MASEGKFEESPHEGRCGAKARSGQPCRQWRVPGRARCHWHGGRSTGAKSPEGIARIRQANTKHGAYSREHQDLIRRIREMRQSRREIVGRLKELARVNPQALRNSGVDPERVVWMCDIADGNGAPQTED